MVRVAGEFVACEVRQLVACVAGELVVCTAREFVGCIPETLTDVVSTCVHSLESRILSKSPSLP